MVFAEIEAIPGRGAVRNVRRLAGAVRDRLAAALIGGQLLAFARLACRDIGALAGARGLPVDGRNLLATAMVGRQLLALVGIAGRLLIGRALTIRNVTATASVRRRLQAAVVRAVGGGRRRIAHLAIGNGGAAAIRPLLLA